MPFHPKIGKNVPQDGSHCGGGHDTAGNIDSRLPGGSVQRHQHNVLRVFHRSDAHEGDDFVLNPLTVFVENVDFLAGSGFAADGEARHLGVFRRALGNHRGNELTHGVRGFFRNGAPHCCRLRLHHRISLRVYDLRDNVRLQQSASVDYGGDGPHQLQGGDFEGLAEGAGGQGGGAPLVGVRHQGFVKKHALALPGQVDAGFLQNPELFDVFIEPLPAQLQGDMGKGNVAGVL